MTRQQQFDAITKDITESYKALVNHYPQNVLGALFEISRMQKQLLDLEKFLEASKGTSGVGGGVML